MEAHPEEHSPTSDRWLTAIRVGLLNPACIKRTLLYRNPILSAFTLWRGSVPQPSTKMRIKGEGEDRGLCLWWCWVKDVSGSAFAATEKRYWAHVWSANPNLQHWAAKPWAATSKAWWRVWHERPIVMIWGPLHTTKAKQTAEQRPYYSMIRVYYSVLEYKESSATCTTPTPYTLSRESETLNTACRFVQFVMKLMQMMRSRSCRSLGGSIRALGLEG